MPAPRQALTRFNCRHSRRDAVLACAQCTGTLLHLFSLGAGLWRRADDLAVSEQQARILWSAECSSERETERMTS